MPEPCILERRDGRPRVELGRCDHTNGRLNRYPPRLALSITKRYLTSLFSIRS